MRHCLRDIYMTSSYDEASMGMAQMLEDYAMLEEETSFMRLKEVMDKYNVSVDDVIEWIEEKCQK